MIVVSAIRKQSLIYKTTNSLNGKSSNIIPAAKPGLIALLSQAQFALNAAVTIDEVRVVRDKAEALRMYAKARGDCHEIQNSAAEVKVRAERKAGEILAVMEKDKGGRPAKTGSTMEPVIRLADVGVEKKQSHRWQRAASVPEEMFEKHVAATIESGKELTSAGIISLAKKTSNKARNDDTVAEARSEADINTLVASGEKFACIYADPPWRYGNQATRAATDNHYPTMTVEEIAALPIGKLAADRAHLWLWTTNGFLFECPKLFEAWGFEFKSSYVWVKPQIGIGNYLRNSHELLLLAVRGGMVGEARNVKSWGEFDRTSHSSKPEPIRHGVIERVSPGPRLELFGRKLVDGWLVWGNQISRTMFDVNPLP